MSLRKIRKSKSPGKGVLRTNPEKVKESDDDSSLIDVGSSGLAKSETVDAETTDLKDSNYWMNLLYCAIGYGFFIILLYLLPNWIRNHGEMWRSLMDTLSVGYKSTDGDKKFIAQFIIGTQGLHGLLLIVLNIFYGIVYWMNHPSIEKYKTERDPWPFHSKDENVRKEFKKLLYWSIVVIIFNNICISIPLSFLAAKMSKFSVEMDDFPDNMTILWQVIICAIIEDALFYWSHRLFHMKSVYPVIHKIHHTWHMPIALSAEFAHPVEFYLGNTLPFALGPGLLKVHMFVLWVWLVIRLCKTGDAHSGYSFPWSPFRWIPFANPSEYHDFHHSEGFTSCYGSFFNFWDTITGTNEQFILKKAREKGVKTNKILA